jgi:hypothetical protein
MLKTNNTNKKNKINKKYEIQKTQIAKLNKIFEFF